MYTDSILVIIKWILILNCLFPGEGNPQNLKLTQLQSEVWTFRPMASIWLQLLKTNPSKCGTCTASASCTPCTDTHTGSAVPSEYGKFHWHTPFPSCHSSCCPSPPEQGLRTYLFTHQIVLECLLRAGISSEQFSQAPLLWVLLPGGILMTFSRSNMSTVCQQLGQKWDCASLGPGGDSGHYGKGWILDRFWNYRQPYISVIGELNN